MDLTGFINHITIVFMGFINQHSHHWGGTIRWENHRSELGIFQLGIEPGWGLNTGKAW